MNVFSAYPFPHTRPTHQSAYLWPALKRILAEHRIPEKRAFDLGCGNGATCNMLSELGFQVTGVDVSEAGIAAARKAFPHVNLHVDSAYEDLAAKYGTYPLVVSLEVIEHCFDPRGFARTFLGLLAPGGVGVMSTPYHGYLKNLALAVTNKLDRHFSALWDGGHIKFFSRETLTQLLHEVGANELRMLRVGRVPPLAKSMIAVVSRPA